MLTALLALLAVACRKALEGVPQTPERVGAWLGEFRRFEWRARN
jgi:hypothetical protein